MSTGSTRQNPMLVDDDNDVPHTTSSTTSPSPRNNNNNNNTTTTTNNNPDLSPPYTLPLSAQNTILRNLPRETRHSALTILADRDVLTAQALAVNDTIPQTRQKFQSRFLAPDDPDDERVLRGERFLVLVGSSGADVDVDVDVDVDGGGMTPLCVSRRVVDVYEEGEEGWIGPGSGVGSTAGSNAGSGFGFGSRSASASGSSTPEKRAGRRGKRWG